MNVCTILSKAQRPLPLALALLASVSFAPAFAQQGFSGRAPSLNGEVAATPGPAATPAPGASTSAVGGAPFPSMVHGPAPASPIGRPQIPLSSQPMAIDDAEVRNRIGRMGQQVDDRMRDLRVGSGQLPSADVSSRMGELETRAAAERQIRELEVRQRQAEAAVKLWSTVYDARREEEAARRTRDAEAAIAAAVTSPATTATSQQAAAQPGQPAVPPGQPPIRQQVSGMSRADLPMARIVSIRGGGTTGLTARLLVPFNGEVSAEVGTRLPGDRRVTSITANGVFISDPDLGTVSLGFGDSVPLYPPQQQARPNAPQTFPANALSPPVIPGMSPMSLPFPSQSLSPPPVPVPAPTR